MTIENFPKLLVSKVSNLEFEKLCLKRYEEIVRYILAELGKTSSLEYDLEVLRIHTETPLERKCDSKLTKKAYFAILYRTEIQ